MSWTTYKERIHKLSHRIVTAQKPIHILNAIKWDPAFEEKIKRSHFREIPDIGPKYYQTIALGYDPKVKLEELRAIAIDIELHLGKTDPIAKLLLTTAEEYISVVEMLQHRGTKQFWEWSKKLYGSPKDLFTDDRNTISDLGRLLYSILSRIDDHNLGPAFPQNLNADEVVRTLNERFQSFFGDEAIKAKMSDDLFADAAAGGDVVKVRQGAKFSSRDIDILEVHEGWVHVGTTQNGAQQHVATWLAKGSPRVSATQEGLAVLMEIFTFRTYPRRARHLNDRVIAIDKVEDGANILELIEFFRTEGYNEDESLNNAIRVFRGAPLQGGAPFTKDISYCRGFIENYNFVRAAIRAGHPEILPFLFVGKIRVDDIPMLYQKFKEGIIDPPKYLPWHFKDLNGVVVWMSFSSFFNMVDMAKIQNHYDKLFKQYL